MSSEKIARVRADVLLVERGLAPSREKAQALILAGDVFAGEVRVDKPGDKVLADRALRVVSRRRFVSRGGDKLDGALGAFGARFDRLDGLVVVDVGASTGGFTDCVLSRGAAHVYAVDVGYGQLDQKLAVDPRVTVRDRTNARHMERDHFDRRIDLVVVDASFIGVDKLAPAIARVLPAGGELVAMVKPQFEVGRELASAHRGVIRDTAVREQGIAHARDAIVDAGFEVVAEIDSAVPGPKGNVERFVWARRRGP